MMLIPTRREIARFVGDDQATIRALEEVFRRARVTFPQNVTDLEIQVGSAIAGAQQAESRAIDAARQAMMAAMAPAAALTTGNDLSVSPAASGFEALSLADAAPATGALIGD